MTTFEIIVIVFAFLFLIGYLLNKNKQKNAFEERSIKLLKYDFSKMCEFKDKTIGVDEKKALFVYSVWNNEPIEVPFKAILDCEVLKDNISIGKISTKGAIVGGILAGGVGAMIGSQAGKKLYEEINSLDLKIYVDNIQNPTIKINFFRSFDGKFNLDRSLKLIEDWEGVFKVILIRNKSN